MKKTFRSILAGALALLAVSCYDDSALRGDIEKLDERVTAIENTLNAEVGGINDLAQRLTAAEGSLKTLGETAATLNTQVAELVAKLDAFDGQVDGIVKDVQAAIAGLTEADKTFASKAELAEAVAKIAVVKVEEKDGNVVLTLADGSALALSKPLASVENSGLVTVVEVGGVNTWAVVAADGTTTSLDVPVGHPDVQVEFSVTESGDLQYSVNGAEPVNTGVNTNDLTNCLIADVVENEDNVVITIGDVEYTLPKYVADNSTIVIKAGKTTFSYGETKEFSLDVKDIVKFYVMTKPDGWKVSLNGKTLVVTAPSEEAVAAFAEADGEVLLHANTADGKCKIAKLGVTTKLELSITVDEAAGLVDITSAMLMSGMAYDPLEGYIEVNQFSQIAVGMASIELFEKDPEAYVKAAENWELPYEEIGMIGFLDNIYGNLYETYFEYQEGVCEVAEYHNISIADLYKTGTYEELPKGSKLIVWAAPIDPETYMIDAANVVYAYYSPVVGSIELVGEPVFDDMNIKVSLYGADGYYVGKVAEPYTMDYMTGQLSFESYISSAIQYMDYGMNALGVYVEEDGDYEYALSEIFSDNEGMAMPLMPNTKYFVYVIPVKDGKAWSEYSYETDVLPYVKEYTTAKLQPGSECSVELELSEVGYTNISVNVYASEGASQVYYYFYEPAMIDELGDGLADDLISNGYSFTESESVVYDNVSAPGTSKTLVALAVDTEGKYGELAILPVQSKAIEYSTTFKATLGEVSIAASGTNYAVTIPVTVEGGTAVKYYYYWSNRVRAEEELSANLPMGIYPYNAATSLPATFMFYSSQAQYQFAVVVESETGELSAPVYVTVDKPAAE